MNLHGSTTSTWRRWHPRGGMRVLSYVSATVVAAASAVVLTASGSGAVVSGSASGFESQDGNMVLNTTAGANTDWNCFIGSDNFQTGTPNANCNVTSGATHVVADTNGETGWVNGQKFDTACPALTTKNTPPKDDFTDVASYSDSANNDVYFYGATIRSTANGNSSGDVEFNQATGNGTTSAGCRTAGDRLLAYEYLNGGTSLDFHVLTWIDSTNTTAGQNTGKCFVKTDALPCWGAKVLTPDAALFDGHSNNTATITAANNGISGAALVINQFAEFGINLTDALGLTGCVNFPQQVWESRSSGSSFTSNPEDIEIAHQTIQSCGTIKIIKHTSPRGADQSFGYTATGLSATTFNLNDNGCSVASCTDNTKSFSNVSPGTYTVTEDADPAGYTFDSVSCTNNLDDPATNVTVTDREVSIDLAANDNVVCTYVNDQEQGALKVVKESSKASADPLSGATFVIKDPNGDALDGSPYTTDSNGEICVDGLTAIGTYTVQETGAPDGYAIDDDTVNNVDVHATNALCSDTTFTGDSKTFTDTPLTDLSVNVNSEVSGGTQSSISCVDSANNDIGDSPKTLDDPVSVTANGLQPGTYTCTVVVDP